jgi:predicted dehydrogenase
MADETKVRFGILGCAQISIKLCKALSKAPNATLIAIGSRSLEKATTFATDQGLPEAIRVYGSYEAVVEDDEVDAVYIPLPTALHVTWAVKAAERGKHVLLEKPVAMNVAELDQILEACEVNGVQFMDGTMWIHHPRTKKMKEALSDEQRFGQLKWVCFYNSIYRICWITNLFIINILVYFIFIMNMFSLNFPIARCIQVKHIFLLGSNYMQK